ncbi:MAG: nucleotidyl transferase AbiEii/AbiGii toxin family protein [Chthoniobacterales bacterium]
MHQRLLNVARQSGRPFNELAQYYALERWLYRLAQSDYRDQFVLKGALMLLVWKMPVTRPTRDIDLLGRLNNDLDSIREVITTICQIPADDDGLFFDPDSVETERIAEDADYEGVRVRFRGTLGNTKFPMQIDIGFSDIITPASEAIVYPTILGQAAPELSAYNRETVIAETFEAMVKLGELNSRMKDFFDIWTLGQTGDFIGEALSLAIQRTFARRGTELMADPICFQDSFATSTAKNAQWSAFLRRNIFVGVPTAFPEVVRFVAAFLRPVVAEANSAHRLLSRWRAGGPWTSRE